MFVQLRRVVYLLVLLQCCACVAYAEGSENVTVTLQNMCGSEDGLTAKMKEKFQEFNFTAEQFLERGSIAFTFLDSNMQIVQDMSEYVEAVVDETDEIIAEEGKTGDSLSQDISDEGTTEEIVMEAKGIIVSLAATAENVRLATRYCNHWSDILDELIAYCGKPTGDHISSESDKNLLAVKPKTTYEELYTLRARIIGATERVDATMEKVKEHQQAVEGALEKLKVLDETLKEEIDKIRDNATKTSATQFKELLTDNGVETTVFLAIEKKHEETAGQLSNKGQSGDAASGPMSSTAVLAVLALTVSTVIGMTVV